VNRRTIMWVGRRAAGGYGLGYSRILPMSNDVVANKLGMGMIGVADDGCDCFVMTDGGYKITDFKSNQSDDILMSAIVVMMMMRKKNMYGYEQKIVCSDK
jgi:hypothetical protein